MMKQSVDASIGFRRQLNDMFTQARHSVQGVATQDVDGLTVAVRRLETRVLGRIEELCDRLDDLSTRLESIEKGGNSNHKDNGHAAARTGGLAASATSDSTHQPENPPSE